MSVKIRLKHSATANKAPLPADLSEGELALNINASSPAAYIKDSAGAIVKIAGANSVTSPPDATTATKGIVQLADAAAVTAGTAGRIIDAAQLKAHTPVDASETAKGVVELATAAETTTGTDATRAVHPAGLKVELDKKANQATTYTKTETDTALALKVNKAGDTMTGNLTVPSLNGGQLAGMRNVLINGDLRINQRGVTIAAAAVGQYGPDRWKKVDATNMTQIVEDVNFVPGATYTLSWKGGTPQQLTAPASGHWTLPNIPITATEVQLELGTVATPFERRPVGVEYLLAERYYQVFKAVNYSSWSVANADELNHSITMTRMRINQPVVTEVNKFSLNVAAVRFDVEDGRTVRAFLTPNGTNRIVNREMDLLVSAEL